MNHEIPDVQARFRKGRGTRDQIANISCSIKQARRVPEKNIYFSFIDYAKSFDCHLTYLTFMPNQFSSVTESYLTLVDTMDCSMPGFRVHQPTRRATNIQSLDHNKLWKILKEVGIPDHLTCLLRNLYACQEATVRTGHGTTDWFQIGKGVHQGCILSQPAYLTSMQSTS